MSDILHKEPEQPAGDISELFFSKWTLKKILKR